MSNLKSMEAFKKYFLDVKPYHTKILEIIQKYTFKEDLEVGFEESDFFNIDWKNDPLCKPVGYGWIWDDECGFDAIDCCDLFECLGGYGLIFDNSALVMEIPIDSIDNSLDTIHVSGNFTYDVRIQINSIPINNTIIFNGDITPYLVHQQLLIIIPVKTLELLSNTENILKIKGNYETILNNEKKFKLYNSGSDDGIYKLLTASYNITTNETSIELLPSQNLTPNITKGFIEFKIGSRNNGAYLIESFDYNGAITTVKLHEDSLLDFTNTTEGANHGSIQLRTGMLAERYINIKDSANNDGEYAIIHSEYNNNSNQTIIHLGSNIIESDTTGVIQMFGYIHTGGFSGPGECSTPKHSNIKVGIGERLIITINLPVPSPTPTMTATVTPTMTITPTITPTIGATLTVTPTPSLLPTWAAQEWVVGRESGNVIHYGAVNDTTGWSLINTTDVGVSFIGLASDGKFVFTGANSNVLKQFKWSGSSLVQVFSGSDGSGGGNPIDVIWMPPIANRLISVGTGGFGRQAVLCSYQSAPAYSISALDITTEDTRGFRLAMGARVGNAGTFGQPDTVVISGGSGTPTFNHNARAYTVNASEFTAYGSNFTNTAYSFMNMDPDTGLILGGTATSSMPLIQLNMTTRVLSLIGTSSSTGPSNVRFATAIKGLVIVLGVDANLRSFSISGTTLTLLDTLASGINDAANAKIQASPYTGLIYMTSTNTPFGKIFKVDEDGTLTQVSIMPIRDPGSGSGPSIAFLTAPLEISTS